ncbi:MAG: outer membrane lipoprotein carrier protein LolA [Bacteroidales bacterium]|nr:outer membrane lipoprotein carrier protein LolA [Bacteroidales bacterium]
MRKLLLMLALLSSLVLPAQNHNEKANAALRNLAAKLKNTKQIRIEFTFKLDNKEARVHEEKKGTMWLSGNKYKIMLNGQIIISDGKAIYTYLPQAREVQISEPDDEGQSLSPLSILSNYENKYRIKYIKERKGLLVVDLLPLEGSRFYKIRLELQSADNQLKSVTLFEREGNTFTYLVDQFDTQRNADPSIFTFNKNDYPGVEVVDLR